MTNTTFKGKFIFIFIFIFYRRGLALID